MDAEKQTKRLLAQVDRLKRDALQARVKELEDELRDEREYVRQLYVELNPEAEGEGGGE